jgi:DNA polymerase-3 subunit delta
MAPTELPPGLGEPKGGVFYLHGTDEHRKESVARTLVEAHLDPATGDFNYDLIRGSELNLETLASALGTPPMMAEWRVVLLRETQALASSQRIRTLLLNTAASPPPGLALVLLCTVPERSSARFYRDLERVARSLEFQTPSLNDLPGWLMEWGRDAFGREITEEAARALAQAVGSDSSALARELEKLSTLAGEGEVITLDVVKSAGTGIPRQDRWKWFDLIGHRRFMEALQGLEILLGHGETGVGLTVGLTTHLLRLGVVVDGGPAKLQAILPPQQRWIAKRYGEQGRLWTTGAIKTALDGLLEVDRLLKASPVADVHFLESWILSQAMLKDTAA